MGVDDGSRDIVMTEQMLDCAVSMGITDMVCTPHVRWDDFDQALVIDRYQQFAQMANDMGISCVLGYEVFYDRLLREGIDEASRYVIEGSNRILIEFNSGAQVPFGWERTFYDIQCLGLEITLAHPERYLDVMENFDMVYRFLDAGCRLQVSAGDLMGSLFGKRRRSAARLMKEGLCNALVSDAHRPGHYEAYGRMLEKYRKFLTDCDFAGS